MMVSVQILVNIWVSSQLYNIMSMSSSVPRTINSNRNGRGGADCTLPPQKSGTRTSVFVLSIQCSCSNESDATHQSTKDEDDLARVCEKGSGINWVGCWLSTSRKDIREISRESVWLRCERSQPQPHTFTLSLLLRHSVECMAEAEAEATHKPNNASFVLQ